MVERSAVVLDVVIMVLVCGLHCLALCIAVYMGWRSVEETDSLLHLLFMMV